MNRRGFLGLAGALLTGFRGLFLPPKPQPVVTAGIDVQADCVCGRVWYQDLPEGTPIAEAPGKVGVYRQVSNEDSIGFVVGLPPGQVIVRLYRFPGLFILSLDK